MSAGAALQAFLGSARVVVLVEVVEVASRPPPASQVPPDLVVGEVAIGLALVVLALKDRWAEKAEAESGKSTKGNVSSSHTS